MTTTPYRKGARFELQARDQAYKDGALLVVRSAGSKTKVDLVAFWDEGPVWLVQVKKDGRIGPTERGVLRTLAELVGGRAMLARGGPRGTPVVFQEIAA